MATNNVVEVLRNDRWMGVEGTHDIGPFILRYRTPVLVPPQIKGYGHVLKIVWPYADEDSGAMPNPEEADQMMKFENRFCEAVEQDATAILTAVLTFDGARQWVFYTDDIQACSERLSNMPQNNEPYPLELTAEQDPHWEYLREEILKIAPVE